MRAILAAVVVASMLTALAGPANAQTAGGDPGSKSVACGSSSSYWNAPKGAIVGSLAPGLIAAVTSSLGEFRSHVVLSHGATETSWVSQNTMAMPKEKLECDEPVDGAELANGWPGGSRVPIKSMYVYYYGDPSASAAFLGYQVTGVSGTNNIGEKVADFFNIGPAPAAGGGCSLAPKPGDINAYNAGLYDYYCSIYATAAYCDPAKSYAAAAGVPIFSPTGAACSTAALYNYYCRYYEYNGYGWDYGSYCTTALSNATTNSCCGGCSVAPKPADVNAFNAGLYDYYCSYYGGTYCDSAKSYAAASGVSIFAPTGAACNTAALYNYYCRYYEYNNYGWDYSGYCTTALSNAKANNCCGGGGGGGNMGCVNVEQRYSAKGGSPYTYYIYKWPSDEDAQHANKLMSYRLNEYVNGDNGNRNLAGTCSAMISYMQKKAMGTGWEVTLQNYDPVNQVKPAMMALWNGINSECRTGMNWWGKLKLMFSGPYCAVSCGTLFSNWSDMCERAATQVAYCMTSDVWSDNCKNGCHSSDDVINKPVAAAKAISPDRLAGYHGQTLKTWYDNASGTWQTPPTNCNVAGSGKSAWACDTYKGVTWSGGGSVYTCWF
jgi:hypothetical protein